jgi:hypothetical protein
MSFVAFTAGEVDADSPLTETFFTKMKDNFDALLGLDVTNGNTHNHFGGDGALIPQGGLKQGTGEVFVAVPATSSAETPILPGGRYGFVPRVRSQSAGTAITFSGLQHSALLTSFIAPKAVFSNSSAGTLGAYAEQTYIQASPPYKIGNEIWGHFLYMLLNGQGDVIAAYEAEDPPYAYNGPTYNAKDSIERIQAVPHPFVDYFDKDPAAEGLEIVLVDLREHDTKKWKSDNAKKGKGILEDLGHINRGGKIVTPQELGIGDIQGFTDKVKIRKV